MTPQEFSAKIKFKYPQYQNIDDTVLAQKMVDKYPVYKSQVDFGDTKLTQTPVYEQPQPTGLLSKIKQSFVTRVEDLGSGYQRQIEGKQGLGSSVLQTAGQGAGFLFDIAGDVLNKGIESLPKIVKKPVSDTINKLAGAMSDNDIIYAGLNAVNQGIDKYKEWEQQHPTEADNLKAIVNLAFVAPVGEGGKIGLEVAGKEAGLAGRALEKSGLDALTAQKQSFVRDLVSPIKTKAIKESQVGRTTETGSGIFKRSIIAPTNQELKAENAVLKVEGIDTSKTFQQNFNIIQEHNLGAAKQLESDILANNFIIPRKEVIAKLNSTKAILGESPTIVGDAQKIADKLLEKAKQIVNQNEGKASGILKARKEYDAWVLSQKPKAFDATSDNAFSIANREIRNVLNNILEEKAPSVGVKESLAHQTSLYNALDVVRTKAALEADTAFGRLLQKTGSLLGTKNKIVQGIAAAAGIGGLGAAATFAPAAAAIGGTGILIYKAGKLVMNPNIRIGLGKVLQEIERVLPMAQPARKIELQSLKDEINTIINNE